MTIYDFIVQAAGKVGVSSSEAGKATAGILGLIRSKADHSDANALLDALPGASDLLGSMAGHGGGLMRAVVTLLGGQDGSALSIISVFQNANMAPSQAGHFAGLFVHFMQQNVNGDLVARVLDQVPEMKELLG